VTRRGPRAGGAADDRADGTPAAGGAGAETETETGTGAGTTPGATGAGTRDAPPAVADVAPRLWRLLLVGIVGGVLSGAFGIGGGIVMVPLLTAFAGLGQKQASATSLAAILPASVVAGATYAVQGEVDWDAALFVALGAVVGTVAGGWLLPRVPVRTLQWLFVVVIVVAAVRLLLTEPDRSGVGHASLLPDGPLTWLALAGLGLLMGVASGLFGIGGGLVAVPGLVTLFGLGDLVAKGTSLAVMVPTSVIGTVGNARRGLVRVGPALLLGATAAVASFGGVALAFVMPGRVSTVTFAVLLLVVAVQQAVRAVRRRG